MSFDSFKKLYFDFVRVTGMDGRRPDVPPGKIKRPVNRQAPERPTTPTR